MSVLMTTAPPSPRLLQVAPRPKLWTRDEFHQLGDEGWFEQSRPILVRGEILETPIPNPRHSTGKALVEDALRTIFAKGFVVRAENPLLLGRSTDPVPDLAVVKGSIRDYSQAQPTKAELVVEVSDSSLDYDTGTKASLYASAGIADYWVLDLVNRQLIVLRDPRADSTQPFGFTYGNVMMYQPGQSVAPLAASEASVAVADLLP